MGQAPNPSPAQPEAAPAPAGRRAARTLLALALVAGVLLVAQRAREALGVDWSPEAIRETVRGFGIWGPVVFLALTASRQLLVLPSVVVLTSAGLLFGAGAGTLLGAVGITLNALALYGGARLLGRPWVLPWLRERWPGLEGRARSAGPGFVALMTGHPAGVLTPFHAAAGITGIALPVFLLAVFPAALVRSGLYAVLGAHLLDVGSVGFWAATGALAVLALAPLGHAGLRRRLWGRS